MRIMVTGAKGMLGREMTGRLSAAGHEVFPADIEEFDVTSSHHSRDFVLDTRPEVIVHCAAMTAVDNCESRVEDAMRVNAIGTLNIAAACYDVRARMVYISTDYVFDGGLDRPYHEWDRPKPQTVYGQTKLAGEMAVRDHCPDHVIARISWLYGHGGPSFLHTMMRLGAEAGEPLKVVDDQFGTPTSAPAVCSGILSLLDNDARGVFHLTCEGETSWYGFTRKIFEIAGIKKAVIPCKTEDFPRPAPRPVNSRLDNRALRLLSFPQMPGWEEALEEFMKNETF